VRTGRLARLAIALLALACATAPQRPPPAQGGATAPAARSGPPAEPAAPPAPPAPPTEPSAPPASPPPPAAVDAGDPLELLWDHRLEFTREGEPLVTIRLMEGQEAITFRPRTAGRVVLRGGDAVEVEAGARLTVRVRDGVPAATAHHVLLAEAPVADRGRLDAARRTWAERGVAAFSRTVGAVHGVAGRVVDNRRELLLAESDGSQAAARGVQESLRTRFGARTSVQAQVVARPTGRLVLEGDDGASFGEADAALWLDAEDDGGFVVEGVLHDHGRRGPAREDRTYLGRLYLTLDARGRLAAVHGVPLEELLRGLVPSEMPGGSHVEALKAQAVTARSNVLAQIGARHLTDPFMLCAEVHCQAYRGDGARTHRTDAAVRATRGEALFGRREGTLVDAVYSALCGGHGEDNDQVWGNTPSASLRGRPDLPPAEAARLRGGLRDEALLRAFLAEPSGAFCRRPAAAPRSRFRWERRFSPTELDAAIGALGLGATRTLAVTSRGVSGRARVLHLVGEHGAADVAGELRIRRLLGDLPSAMFVVDHDGPELVLRGGGWGHGAGMCQWGAIGRAEAGQGYREILRAYYSGAEVATLY
jgi:SpoIID/LytB domain protein